MSDAPPPKPRIRPRFAIVVLIVIATVFVAGALWSPGVDVRDGRHDRGGNGIWLQHGWLGDDGWFARNQRDKSKFRDDAKIAELAALLKQNHITDVFPHVCPCDVTGRIAPVDAAQVERFLDGMPGVRVIPWIGGVFEVSAFPAQPAWRKNFVDSAVKLLRDHPRLAGVQVNIEPMPSGNADFLALLDELQAALPEGKVLSIAAYPPPTRWQPSLEVHWDEAYFRAVAARADQMAVMMYDTSIGIQKTYRALMKDWTREVLAWSGSAQVLLGVPTYDDAGSGYHDPKVENLENALLGIHAGLASFSEMPGDLPPNYRGVAIYCEWEMDEREWQMWRERFTRPKPAQ